MEDTINKFEETFGSGSHDSHVIQKRGSGTPKSPPFGGGTTTNNVRSFSIHYSGTSEQGMSLGLIVLSLVERLSLSRRVP